MKLHELIAKYFSPDDLIFLCEDLGIPYDQFSGGKKLKALQIVQYCEQRKRTKDLIGTISRRRPELKPDLEKIEHLQDSMDHPAKADEPDLEDVTKASNVPNTTENVHQSNTNKNSNKSTTIVNLPNTFGNVVLAILIIGLLLFVGFVLWDLVFNNAGSTSALLSDTPIPTSDTDATNTAVAATATQNANFMATQVKRTVEAEHIAAEQTTIAQFATAHARQTPDPSVEAPIFADVLTPEPRIVLVSPPDRFIQAVSQCVDGSQITFKWGWAAVLDNTGRYGGEFFAVRFGLAEDGPHSIVWTKDRSYILETTRDIFDMQSGEVYAWNVAVVKPYGEPRYEKWFAIDQSETWEFVFCGGERPTPIPTATHTATPIPHTPTPSATTVIEDENPDTPASATPAPTPTRA